MKALANKRFVVTVSYGDYTRGSGGTDKYILSQQKILNDAGISVLHIYPFIGFSRLIPSGDLWGLCVDGVFRCICTTSQATALIQDYTLHGHHFYSFLIHHLMRVNIKELMIILTAIPAPVFFHVHDYRTVCPGSGCIRENRYCGVVKPGDKNCQDCSVWNDTVRRQQEEVRAFFSLIEERATVVAPSACARNIWLSTYPEFRDRSMVIYHQTLVGTYRENHRPVADDEKLKIAFVGYQSPLKGWQDWIEAADAVHASANYELFHFGRCEEHRDYIKEVKVDFKQSQTAMIDALRAYGINCAVLWSPWPETYSFTYYEAFAANCFVLTQKRSGNIAYQVANNENGIVADETESLCDILTDEQKLRSIFNTFAKDGVCGPDRLEDNTKIVSLCSKEETAPKSKVRVTVRDMFGSLFWNVLFNMSKQRRRKII